MAYYNGQKYFKQQLESIINQSKNNFSLTIFISDDNSKEEFPSLLDLERRNIKNCEILYKRSLKNNGYALNFLNSLKEIEDEFDYYCFSDQDDVWLPKKLRSAIEKIDLFSDKEPNLYFGRTTYYNENCSRSLKKSTFFRKKPCFKNALIQNIAAGNTIVFNKKARNLIVSTLYENFNIVSHDWWFYQVITGVEGNIFYDNLPFVKYRQHKNNLLGSNNSLSDVTFRIFYLIIGKWKKWNNTNLKALNRNRHLLTKENQIILENFKKLRNESFFKRIFLFKTIGIFRQTIYGNIVLALAVIFKRV